MFNIIQKAFELHKFNDMFIFMGSLKFPTSFLQVFYSCKNQ